MSTSSFSFSRVDPSRYEYDVFMSVRGDVTSHNFTSHLYSALLEKQIEVFVETVEEKIDIERAIEKRAIEKSAISIIVFSEDYASAAWCLDQLVHILKCKKEKGQIVLPIFHGVDPSHIWKQKGSLAFVNPTTRKKYTEALIEASGLSGWDSRGKSDSELVEAVVQDVVRRLTEIRSTSVDNSDGLLGGAFLSAFVEDLFRRLRSPDFLDYLKGKEPIQKKFRAVKRMLLYANMVLNDAEEKQLTNAAVKKWLDHLKELIFRADELMENINYEVLRRKLGGASESSTSIATFGKLREEEIAGILFELEPLIAQKDKLGLKVLSLRSYGEPLVLESDVHGREDDKEATKKLEQSDSKPMVVPIVGMGGIGKTTVAQLVYGGKAEKKPPPPKKMTQLYEDEILKPVKKPPPQPSTKQPPVRKTLRYKPEPSLKTTTKQRSPPRKIMQSYAKKAFPPGVYGREDEKKAFNPEVYGREDAKKAVTPEVYGREDTDLNAHPDLLSIIGEEMGDIGKSNLGEYLNALRKEIANKCKGHPIAVNSVVALLSSIASPDEWRMILENHIWDLKLTENASKYVLPALWLSYRYLSPLLKRCLVYCSIFPKDYEFDKEKVILLWMAEGLLQSKRRTRVEDVGEDFFQILTSRSFFQQSVHDKSKFTMHDCVHDLATFVLGDFGFRLEDDNMHNIPSKTRHLSFMKEKIGDMKYFQGISEARHLRTFLPLESNQPFRDAVPLEELLTERECLRVLSLSQYPRIAELPNSILESKPLRYLDLSSTSIRNIPDTICTLYNLETLLLSNCENLTRLPSEIRRLIKLRHLDFAGSPIEELPPRICELKDLQTLTRFIVCKEHSRIEELGDLQQLRGEFEICGLENVVDVKNVYEAELREKKFLTSLGLYWDGESCYGTSEAIEILEELQPHQNLKALRIYGFAGERFPDWMGDQSFGNMVEVQLSECKNCKSLPPLGQLPSLKNLQILGFKSVETIGPEFYSDGSSTTKPFGSLEVLRFEDMAMWKGGLFTKDQAFHNLKELVFYECPKLDVWLPDCFPSLTKLLVSHCRQLMPLLIPTTHQRCGFGSLEELEIFACPKQVIFLQGGLPSSLKKIQLSRCNSLKLFHYQNFQHLTSLESLEIIECKELRRLPEERPAKHFELSIVECPFLESGG